MAALCEEMEPVTKKTKNSVFPTASCKNEPEPKCIVCYGDSNTHGANGDRDDDKTTGGGKRIPYAARWTTVLERTLTKNGFPTKVIAEGLSGRTTVLDDEHCWDCCDGAPHGMNGRTFLLPCLNSHKPVDVVVLALGTNDLKHHLKLSPKKIAAGVSLLLRDMKHSTVGVNGGPPARVLVVPPPPLDDQRLEEAKFEEFLPDAASRAKELGRCLQTMVQDNYRTFQDAVMKVTLLDNTGVSTGKDGLHYNATGSKQIGTFMAEAIEPIL